MGDWERLPVFVQVGCPVSARRLPSRGGGRSAWRDDGNCSGCMRLQSYVNSAAFFTLLHRQVLDLLDWPEGQGKFKTRFPLQFYSRLRY